MAAVLYPLFTCVSLALLPWGVYLYVHIQCLEMLLLIFIVIAITYDNAVISLGQLIGEGDQLLWLSQPRFFLHIALTPLSILAALCQGQRFGLGWSQIPAVGLTVWGLTLGVVVVDLVTYYRDFDPVPVSYQGTLRYSNASAMVPPIPAILTVLLIGIMGALMWYQVSWPWLCLSAVVTFACSAIPPRWVGPTLNSGTELILLVGFWATEAHLQAGI